jgi:hypothetical protein
VTSFVAIVDERAQYLRLVDRRAYLESLAAQTGQAVQGFDGCLGPGLAAVLGHHLAPGQPSCGLCAEFPWAVRLRSSAPAYSIISFTS